jgi:hypothetical protein
MIFLGEGDTRPPQESISSAGDETTLDALVRLTK